MAALNPWQKEILDGFREQLADFPAAVQTQTSPQHVCRVVLHNAAESDLETLLAGRQEKLSVTFCAERTALAAAGIALKTKLKIVGAPATLLCVETISADPADPIARVTAHELA